MGSGAWSTSSYRSYTTSKGIKTTARGDLDDSYSAQHLYKQNRMVEELNPYNVTRECRDTDEHPNTVPVVLALDVTGSMSNSLEAVAKKLNTIITSLFSKVKDVEIMVCGIGDLAYDDCPLQVSQFESDVRIADHLNKIYFERGGGGNSFESYTAAWYFAARHTDLDCWKRGQKGILITLGDEPLNPYLPHIKLSAITGDELQGDVETCELYKEVCNKYDVYHIAISDTNAFRIYNEMGAFKETYGRYMDDKHFVISSCDNLHDTIVNIISNAANGNNEEVSFTMNKPETVAVDSVGEISW